MIELEMEKDNWREYHALGKEAKKTSKKLDAITEKITKLEAKQSELQNQLEDLNYQHSRAHPEQIKERLRYGRELAKEFAARKENGKK